MKNGIVWTTDIAVQLESLFHKESILDEHLEVVDSLILRWQRIAMLIKFGSGNEDDILKIKEFKMEIEVNYEPKNERLW